MQRPERHVRHRPRRAGRKRSACRPPPRGFPPKSCTASSRCSASISPPIRSTPIRRARQDPRPDLGGFRRFREKGRDRRPSRRHGHVEAGAQDPHRQQDGHRAFSDVSGQFEAVLFSEALNQYRDLLEPGKSLVMTVPAEERPEGIGLRIQTLQSLEQRSLQMQKALRVYVLRDAGPLRSVATHLNTTRRWPGVASSSSRTTASARSRWSCSDRYRMSPRDCRGAADRTRCRRRRTGVGALPLRISAGCG